MEVPNPNYKPKAREKRLEPLLKKKVEAYGGIFLKIPALHFAGIPDRLALLPGGRCVFAEMKSEGKKPTKIQLAIHARLRRLGFSVWVISTKEELDEFTVTELI